ncbi:MAG: hypothetical protein ABSB42_04645 [Tepidisphaeraceae bacterium]
MKLRYREDATDVIHGLEVRIETLRYLTRPGPLTKYQVELHDRTLAELRNDLHKLARLAVALDYQRDFAKRIRADAKEADSSEGFITKVPAHIGAIEAAAACLPDHNWIYLSEAAKAYNIPKSRLHAALRKGDIKGGKFYRPGGGPKPWTQVVLLRKSIEVWRKSRRRQSTGPSISSGRTAPPPPKRLWKCTKNGCAKTFFESDKTCPACGSDGKPVSAPNCSASHA